MRDVVKSGRRARGIAVLAAGLALLGLLAMAPAALAHAILTHSDPADGAVVAQAPREVRLWFSESLAQGFSQARLLDVQGQPVAGAASHVDPDDRTLLVLTLPSLPEGTYNVIYGALSADDGHADQGHIAFTVGVAANVTSAEAPGAASAPAGPLGTGPAPAPPEVGLRWLVLIGLTGVLGALPVALVLLRPTSAGAPEVGATLAAARRRIWGWATICALAAFCAGAGLLVWQAYTLRPPGSTASWAATLLALAAGTRGGQLWLQREILVAAAAGLLLVEARGRGTAEGDMSSSTGLALALFTAAALGTQALASHAAGLAPGGYLAVLMDWLHLVGAGLWMGGLVALAAGLLPLAVARRRDTSFAALLQAGWRPFGGLAALSVGLLLATGIYSMGRQVASPDALLATVYGRTLLVKIVLALGAGALGLANASTLHPGLAGPWRRLWRRPPGWTPLKLQRLPLLILLECAAGLLVLLASGALAASSPPHGAAFAPVPRAQPMDALGDHVDNLFLTFQAAPNQAGSNTFTAGVLGHEGPPPDVLRVILRFTYLAQAAGTISADAQPSSPGFYRLAGPQTSLAGPWQVEVVVRRRGQEDTIGHFRWTVAAPPRRVLVSDRPWEPVLTPLAVALLGLDALAAAAWLARARSRRGMRAREPQPRTHGP